MKKSLIVLMVLLSGCASKSEPSYEIYTKQFHEKKDRQGNKLFAYVVSVKAKNRENLNLDTSLNKRPSRAEVKDFIEQEHFEDSRVLKLELEDDAVKLLNKELETRNYCDNKHEVTDVLWRDLSVQLRGRCL